MKNILISGYYGFYNTGDELVLQEIIKGLKRVDKNLEITVLSADPKHTEKDYGVKAQDRWKLWGLIKSISKTHILISGGGSLLQDKTSKNGILYYLGIIFLSKIFRKKVYIFSQGIGPVDFSRNQYFLKKILSLTDYISVRDQESMNFLKKIGIRKEIVLSGDPVFLIQPGDEDKRKRLWKKAGLDEGKKLITISLRPWKNIDNIIKEINLFMGNFSREEYQVRYLSFHQGEDDKLIGGKVPKDEIIDFPLNPNDINLMISSSFLIIGMRLHSLILAAAHQVKFISISYDPKVDALDKEIYNSSINISVDNISQDILFKKYKIVNDMTYSSEEIKKRALRPFEYLKDR